MRNLVTLCLLLLLQASALAQSIKSDAETRYILTGIDGYEIVGDVFLVPEESKPKLRAVGLVTIDSEASIVLVEASDANRKPVEVQRLAETKSYVVVGTGKVWIDVTAVDFEKQIFERDTFQIVIGKDPVPEDPEDPTPPPGDLQDLLRISKEAAAAVNDPTTAAGLAASIRAAVTAIDDQCARGTCPGLAQAKASVVQAIEQRLLMRQGASRNADWVNGWRVPVNLALQALNTSTVPSYLAAMRAVATGLEGR